MTPDFQSLLQFSRSDALLVSNPYNIYYLSGFMGLSESQREAWVLLTKKTNYFFTDLRHQTSNISPDFIVQLIALSTSLVWQLKKIIAEHKMFRLGFESEDLRYQEYVDIKKRLNAKLIPTKNLIREIRALKTASETENIKQAC